MKACATQRVRPDGEGSIWGGLLNGISVPQANLRDAVTTDVVASLRDQTNKRARSTNADPVYFVQD